MEQQKKNNKTAGKGSGLLIAFSLYSRIPVPQTSWTEAGMRYALCFFPLVGAVIGGTVYGFVRLAELAGLNEFAWACIGTALPLMITGGIHMDGFLDTVDARSSCQAREKKLEILKDPHTGAFAIIGCGIYLLLYLAVFSQLTQDAFPAAAGVYVMVRALSGWSVVFFPKAKKDGLAYTFAEEARKRAVGGAMVFWWASAAALLLWAGGIAGGLAILAAVMIFIWYYRMAVREFGGVTGDLAGYFLQICELGMLAVFAAAGLAEKLGG